MSDNENFKKELDELVNLFRKLQKKLKGESIPGVDDSYVKNIELFLKSYESSRDQISDAMLQQMGQPVKDMIRHVIQQLKEELGDDLYYDLGIEREDDDEVEQLDTDDSKRIEVGPSLEEIDRMLAIQNLPMDEMNRLLDERAKLVKQLKVEEDQNSNSDEQN